MRFTSTIDDPGVHGLYARPGERRPACGAHSCGSASRRRSGVEGANLSSYKQRLIAENEGPGPAPSWRAGYPAAPSVRLALSGYPPPGRGARRLVRALWYALGAALVGVGVIGGISVLVVTLLQVTGQGTTDDHAFGSGARYGIGGHITFGDFAGPIPAAGTGVAVFIAGIVTLIVTAVSRNRRITVQPPLNWAAVMDVSQLIGWPSAASRARMLFQLPRFQVTAVRPAAAMPLRVHDRHNVSTLVDERQPAALHTWSATQKLNVMRAGRRRGTQ